MMTSGSDSSDLWTNSPTTILEPLSKSSALNLLLSLLWENIDFKDIFRSHCRRQKCDGRIYLFIISCPFDKPSNNYSTIVKTLDFKPFFKFLMRKYRFQNYFQIKNKIVIGKSATVAFSCLMELRNPLH